MTAVDSLTFAVLLLPVVALAIVLEWYGPTYGSSPWLRRALWYASACLFSLSVAPIVKRWVG